MTTAKATRHRGSTTGARKRSAPVVRDQVPPSGLHAHLLHLQRTAGNAATVQLLRDLDRKNGMADAVVQRRGGKKPKASAPAGPYVAKIGKEQVRVANADEEAAAKAMIKKFSETYGVKLSSGTTVAAIKKEYPDVPSKVKSKLATSTWEMKELRAVEAALAHYAPILGKARNKSSLGKKAQGVTSIGRVKQAIDEDSAQGVLDSDTLGEQFSSKKNVGLFDEATNDVDTDFKRKGKAPDNATSLEATAIHEMAHGLVEPYHLGKWVEKLDYWTDSDTASGEVGAEAPPTSYGEESAGEDLCESVATYFINRGSLKAACPKREAFVHAIVKGWDPPKKAAVVKKSAKK